MEIAVRYFTKSKKGNTKKIASYLEKKLNVEVKTIEDKLDKKVDILFLLNAMYAANIDSKVKKYILDNKDKIGLLVDLCNSCSGKSTYNKIKKVCQKANVKLCDKHHVVIGSWLMFNKDRPNNDDLEKAYEFTKNIINDYLK